jgi:hypothetical protein
MTQFFFAQRNYTVQGSFLLRRTLDGNLPGASEAIDSLGVERRGTDLRGDIFSV